MYSNTGAGLLRAGRATQALDWYRRGLQRDPHHAPSNKSLGGSAQSSYDVVPANYVLQAVPLGAGRHRLRLEYRPRTFTAGLLLSAAAWIALAVSGLARARRVAGGRNVHPIPT